MITGQLCVQAVTSALRAGAVDFLQKPFRLAELGAVLGRATTQARLRRAAARKRQDLAQALASSNEARVALARHLGTSNHRLSDGC